MWVSVVICQKQIHHAAPRGEEKLRVAVLRGEGAAAAAALRRIGIDEVEALTHQRLFIIQDHAVQVDEALRVNEQLYAIELIHAVALAGLGVKANVVAQPGAS